MSKVHLKLAICMSDDIRAGWWQLIGHIHRVKELHNVLADLLATCCISLFYFLIT